MYKEIYNPRYDSVLGLEEALRKAEEECANLAIKEDDPDFVDLYGEDEIKHDLTYVAKREKKFAEEEEGSAGILKNKRLAKVLESIIFDQGELSNWFGEQALTIKTSRYDDIANGVDMVIEFADPAEHAGESFDRLGLAIDISFRNDVSGKFDHIKDEIDSGELTEVKYFKSERSRAQHLEHLPRVIIDCAPETIEELVKFWVTKDHRRLAYHPIQVQMLHEISEQLKVLGTYARLVAKRDNIADTYEYLRTIIDPLLAAKRKEFGPMVEELYDRGFKNTLKGLSMIETKITAAEPKVDPEERRRQILEKYPYLNKNKKAA